MSIQPMIVYEPDAAWIDTVYVLPKHLAAGDLVYRPAYIGQSTYAPPYTFEIEAIEQQGDQYILTVRYDYGGRDVLTWKAWNISHECVVGGDKILRANTQPGAVKRTWIGWVWKGSE